MKLKINELLALVYADIFDYPLTQAEVKLWSLAPELAPVSADSQNYRKIVGFRGNYYFLKGREELVDLRKKRQAVSKIKLIKLIKLIKIIKQIPSVEGVFVTGSVAVLNANEKSDLDLMIVTRSGTMWSTRLKLLRKLKAIKELRDKTHVKDRVCMNIFLDRRRLEVKNKNLYTAHEILQAKCLFDRGGVEKEWLLMNSWAGDFLPGAYKYQISNSGQGPAVFQHNYQSYRSNDKKISLGRMLLEVGLFAFQYLYMVRKITNERVGWGYAFFHPNDLSEIVVRKYEEKIKKYVAEV